MIYKFNLSIKHTLQLLLVGCLSIGLQFNTWAQKEKIERTISESYSVSSSDKLKINNRYGEVVINTWNQNKITVDIKIEAWGKSRDQAQQQLDRIHIEYGKTGGLISFLTEIDNNKKNWNWGNNKSGFEINYTVNMPKGNPLDLSNKYGSIQLADFDGDLDLTLGYGSITAGNISDKDASITIKYSKASFKDIGGGELTFRYSGNITVRNAGKINLSDRYGGVKFESVKEIDADIAYSGLKIGTLEKSMSLKARYAGSSVGKVNAGFKSIDVDTAYGSCSLGFAKNTDFDFDIEARYGGFKNGLSNVYMHKSIKRNTSAEYEGNHGTKGKARVNCEASYGSITFNYAD